MKTEEGWRDFRVHKERWKKEKKTDWRETARTEALPPPQIQYKQ